MPKAIIVRPATDADRAAVSAWPIWEKEVSRFDWKYDQTETCLILAGSARITPLNVNMPPLTISAGDFVIFNKGTHVMWDITSDIKKHYNFS